LDLTVVVLVVDSVTSGSPSEPFKFGEIHSISYYLHSLLGKQVVMQVVVDTCVEYTSASYYLHSLLGKQVVVKVVVDTCCIVVHNAFFVLNTLTKVQVPYLVVLASFDSTN
jgi:hypothetical protein